MARGLWALAAAAALQACAELPACDRNADDEPFADDPWLRAALRARGSAAAGRGAEDADQVLRAEHEIAVPGLAAGAVAFNPALARHLGRLVAAFRVEARGGDVPMHNRIAMTTLGDDLRVDGSPSMLDTFAPAGHLGVAEDPRLIGHRGELYLIYNASDTARIMGPRTLHIARVVVDADSGPWRFHLVGDRRLLYPDAAGRAPRISKNWSPFVHDGLLHLIYQSNPLEVLRLEDAELAGAAPFAWCRPLSRDAQAVPWRYGAPRGGTPAVWDAELGRFVTLFHSRRACRGEAGEATFQYLTGMYTFTAEPPFTVAEMLPHPLMTPTFLDDLAAPGHTVNFVAGLVLDENHATVSFGRNDARAAVMVLDKRRLFAGLVPVDDLRPPPAAAGSRAP